MIELKGAIAVASARRLAMTLLMIVGTMATVALLTMKGRHRLF